jgi:phosphonate transport system substrate-binding protein
MLLLVLSVFNLSCANQSKEDSSKPVVVDFSSSNKDIEQEGLQSNTKPIEVAIAAMTSPNESYKYYNDLIQYFSVKLNRPMHIVQRKTYAEINTMLTQSKVDLAFICSGAYISAVEGNLPIELLTIPIIDGKAYYHAYIIVNSDSKMSTFSDLKGKSFAYTDPLSNTGYLYGLSMIKEIKQNPSNFFSKTLFTYAHDYSIQAVERKIADGATINSLIFDYIKKKNPEKVSHIKIINISEPFGIPPVVVRKNLDDNLKENLRKLFINIHTDKRGSEIIKNLLIDKYCLPDSTDYTSILLKSKWVGR